MIKNIIFDLGNVLINFRPEKFLLRYTKDKERIKSFINKVPRSKTWLNLDRGILTIEQAYQLFLKKYPDKRDLLNIFFRNNKWMNMLTPIHSNVEILKELKKNGYKLYILSSFIKEAYLSINSRYEFLNLFDGAVISYQEGKVKPEEELYKILIDRYDLKPKECLFIDDHKIILKPARKLGMDIIHYQPKKDLREELRKHSVNI